MEPHENVVREHNRGGIIQLNSKNAEIVNKETSQTDSFITRRDTPGSETQDRLSCWEPSAFSPKQFDAGDGFFSQKGKGPLAPVYNPKDALRVAHKASRPHVDCYVSRPRSLRDSEDYGKKPPQETRGKLRNGGEKRRVENESDPLFRVPSIRISEESQGSVLLDHSEPVIDQTTLPRINTSPGRCWPSVRPATPRARGNMLTLPELDQPFKAFMPPRRNPSLELGHRIPLPRIDISCAVNKGETSFKAVPEVDEQIRNLSRE